MSDRVDKMNPEWTTDEGYLQESLLVLGDIHAGASSPLQGSHPWGIEPDLLGIMQKAGACIANLEGVLGGQDHILIKTGKPSLGLASLARQLSTWHISLVSLANNHAYDCGTHGLAATLTVLANIGIRHVGAGACQAAAWKHQIIRIGSKEVAILGISQNEFGITHGDYPGIAGFDELLALRSIRCAKAASDRVVVLYHGGIEYLRVPSPQLRQRCQFMIEAGADAVICQHSHISGPSEIIDGKVIVYGQGDFVARTRHPSIQAARCPANIIALNFARNDTNCDLQLLPLRTSAKNDQTIRQLRNDDMTDAMNEIANLNALVQDEDRWLREWNTYIRQRGPILEAQLAQSSLLRHRLARRFSFFRKKLTGKHRTAAENLIRCEAHREPLVEWLQGISTERKD